MSNNYPTANLHQILESKYVEPIVFPDLKDVSWAGKTFFQDSARVKELCHNARRAFELDGLFNTAIGRFIDTQAGFRVTGNKRARKYLEDRLNQITFQSTMPWQTILSMCWTEHCITGNAALLKVRGDVDKAFRPFYENNPYPIKSLYATSLDRLKPVVCNITGKEAWAFQNSEIKLRYPGSKPLNTSKSYIKDLKLEDSLMAENRDLLPLTYLRQIGSRYGMGIGFAALEDVRLLRQLEQALHIMVKKTMIPVTHIKVSPSNYTGDINSAIREIRDTIRNMGKDNYLITGPNADLKVSGYESQSLRTEGPLSHGMVRAVAGLSSSPFEIGLEKGNMGDAEASANLRQTKMAKAKAEFLRTLNYYFAWELLYEGGFNPFDNPMDRASIEFIEPDSQNIRTNINFWVDAYVKGFVGWEEALSHCPEISEDMDRADTYVYNVELVKLKAEHDSAKELARINRKNASSTTTRSEARDFLEAVLDSNTSTVIIARQISNYLEIDVDFVENILVNYPDNLTRQELILEKILK